MRSSTFLLSLQERNIHDYFDDFVDEIDMYSDAGRLLDFLSRWSSPKPFFFDRALDLANDMVAEGFWGAKVRERLWLLLLLLLLISTLDGLRDVWGSQQ